MISLIFDAVYDPLIGQWSDRMQSRFGRRHPFIYACAVPLALMSYLLWNPPRGALQSIRVLVPACDSNLMATRLLFSLYEAPSGALAPDLTTDYDERTSLLSYRFFFGNLGGTAMAVLAFQVFLRNSAEHPLGVLYCHGYEQFAVVAALVMLVTILGSALGTQGHSVRSARPAEEQLNFADTLQQMVTALSNRSFPSLTISGIFGGIGNGLVNALTLYIATYF